jgi:hypothetical protein
VALEQKIASYEKQMKDQDALLNILKAENGTIKVAKKKTNKQQ